MSVYTLTTKIQPLPSLPQPMNSWSPWHLLLHRFSCIVLHLAASFLIGRKDYMNPVACRLETVVFTERRPNPQGVFGVVKAVAEEAFVLNMLMCSLLL